MSVRNQSVWFLGILLAGCALGSGPAVLPTPTLPPETPPVAEALRSAVAGNFPLDALTIQYRVGSESWGGATNLLIQGAGNVELTSSLEGEHTTWLSAMTDEEFLGLCQLLVEHNVWAVRGEREIGIPDEAYPNVTISAEGYEPVAVGMYDGEAAEHPDYGPIVRELDGLVYRIQTSSPY